MDHLTSMKSAGQSSRTSQIGGEETLEDRRPLALHINRSTGPEFGQGGSKRRERDTSRNGRPLPDADAWGGSARRALDRRREARAATADLAAPSRVPSGCLRKALNSAAVGKTTDCGKSPNNRSTRHEHQRKHPGSRTDHAEQDGVGLQPEPSAFA
jgi:hypothetical protein